MRQAVNFGLLKQDQVETVNINRSYSVCLAATCGKYALGYIL